MQQVRSCPAREKLVQPLANFCLRTLCTRAVLELRLPAVRTYAEILYPHCVYHAVRCMNIVILPVLVTADEPELTIA